MKLLPTAIIISLLGFMEAIAIAKAMAAKTGQKLDPNQELIGQGLANISRLDRLKLLSFRFFFPFCRKPPGWGGFRYFISCHIRDGRHYLVVFYTITLSSSPSRTCCGYNDGCNWSY